jgi:hypothetical protein
MIDKSIRQHYQNGEKVDPFKKGMKIIMPRVKEQIKSQALPKEGRKLPNIIRAPLQRTALSKLGLGALNPILGLLSLFGIDPLGWAGRKLTEGGVKQAYQAGMTGFGSPAEGRELRQLEARRANMLRRKEEGKTYSQKNLDEVTNRINEIKGDPYEFEDRRTAPQRKQIIDQLYEFEDKKTEQLRPQIIPETPEIISPHLLDGADKPTPTLTTDFAFEDAKRAAQEKAAQERQAAEEQRAAQLAAEVAAAAAKRNIQQHTGNGGGGGGSGQAASRAGGGSQQAQSGGASPSGGWGGGWGWAKGGRVDKALGGRVRDI